MTPSSNEGHSAWLYMPSGKAGAAVLVIELGASNLAIHLPPSLAAILEILNAARDADAFAGWPPEVRGWRTAEQIAKAVADQSQWSYPVSPGSIRKYIGRIDRAIREAHERQRGDQAGDLDLRVVVRRRALGYKLGMPVQIVRPKPR